MIRLRHLFHSYDQEHMVLQDVNLTLEKGSFHFLGGPSGAGKSTLMSMISLMRRPTRGKVEVFGIDTTKLSHEELPALRRRVGMVYQDFRLLDHLTVEENIALPLKVMGEPKKRIRAKAQEMAEWVGLKEDIHTMPPVLSGGQKQRVAIARAVITNPDIILADEPSGNLDRALSERFMHLFKELHKQGTTVLYATHDEALRKKYKFPTMELAGGTVTLS